MLIMLPEDLPHINRLNNTPCVFIVDVGLVSADVDRKIHHISVPRWLGLWLRVRIWVTSHRCESNLLATISEMEPVTIFSTLPNW